MHSLSGPQGRAAPGELAASLLPSSLPPSLFLLPGLFFFHSHLSLFLPRLPYFLLSIPFLFLTSPSSSLPSPNPPTPPFPSDSVVLLFWASLFRFPLPSTPPPHPFFPVCLPQDLFPLHCSLLRDCCAVTHGVMLVAEPRSHASLWVSSTRLLLPSLL